MRFGDKIPRSRQLIGDKQRTKHTRRRHDIKRGAPAGKLAQMTEQKTAEKTAAYRARHIQRHQLRHRLTAEFLADIGNQHHRNPRNRQALQEAVQQHLIDGGGTRD